MFVQTRDQMTYEKDTVRVEFINNQNLKKMLEIMLIQTRDEFRKLKVVDCGTKELKQFINFGDIYSNNYLIIKKRR